MTKKEKILSNLQSNKEIQKKISKESLFGDEHFIKNAQRYIKAIKSGRMSCIITSVSQSGMSRNLKFMECDGSKKDGFRYYNFNMFFTVMGYAHSVKDRDSFLISGGGMDMVFHTNYSIIHRLGSLGFLNKKEVANLAQKTPPVL